MHTNHKYQISYAMMGNWPHDLAIKAGYDTNVAEVSNFAAKS